MLLIGGLSNALVAISPNFWLLLLGRFVLGFSIAACWSFAFGVGVRATRLRPAVVSTGLSSGTSLATILAVPLASLLGDRLGWRTVFWLLAAAMVPAAAGVARTIPPVFSGLDEAESTLSAVDAFLS